MTGTPDGLLREIAHGALRVERARLAVTTALRLATITAILLLAATWLDLGTLGISLTLGALFVGLADLGEDYPSRARTLAWALVWCSGATLLGGLVAPVAPLHIIVAVVVALGAGFVGALGLRGAFIGLITLVLFTIYSGQIVTGGLVLADSTAFVIGGALSWVAAMAAWPLRRLGATRSVIAAGYRAIAVGAAGPEPGIAAPAIAAACRTGAAAADAAPASGRSRTWLVELAAAAQDLRLTLMALDGQCRGTRDAGAAARVSTSVAALARATGRRLAWPALPRGTRRMASGIRGVREATAELVDPGARELGGRIADIVDSIGDLLAGAWPIGAGLERGRPSTAPGTALLVRLRAHLRAGDVFVEHAIRLAIAIGIATAISTLDAFPHSYWLPMTVAWIVKPDLAGTVGRIAGRILGTLVGASIAVALVTAVPGAAPMILLSTLGALVLAAYLWANYAVAIVGLTMMVLSLFALGGEPIDEDFVLRIVLTLVGGLLALLVVVVRPRRSGGALVASLAATAEGLGAYAAVIRAGGDSAQVRARVLEDRTRAAATVAAAVAEPPGLWDRRRPSLDPHLGVLLLDDIVEAITALLAEEILSRELLSRGAPNGSARPDALAAERGELWSRAEAAARDLGRHLRRLEQPLATDDVGDAHPDGSGEHPALRALSRARLRLETSGLPAA